MATIASLLAAHVTLRVRSVDRIFLHGYVPRLQTQGLLVRFLLDQGVPIPSPALLGKNRDDHQRHQGFPRRAQRHRRKLQGARRDRPQHQPAAARAPTSRVPVRAGRRHAPTRGPAVARGRPTSIGPALR